MRRLAALLILGVGGLLLIPGAPGGAGVPADPTTPEAPALTDALDIQVEITGSLGANNWYLSNVTVKWTVTGETWNDCTTQTLTVETPGQKITCSARNDDTGEEASKSVTIKIDKTKPTAAPSPSPQANQHGWHRAPVTVTFVGSDAMAGPDQSSCTVQGYSGPDTQGHAISGTCKDLAGNTSNASAYTVKYDTADPHATGATPSRPPDAHGWYNHALTVTFDGNDNLSGIENCTEAPYSGPDKVNAAVNGSCTDKAGNQSASSSFQLSYDATKPTATPSPSPQPNQHGWHRAPLTVTFVGSDAMSGPDQPSCTVQGYSGPDIQGHPISGTCKDLAGNTSNASTFTVKYDVTKPTATPLPGPPPNQHGWHRAPVTVSFVGGDSMSGPDQASCTAPESYSGPDTQGHAITGTCKDLAGNTSNPSTYTVKYDVTKPTATPLPGPLPNQHGWHKAPLTITFVGNDGMSGPDQPSCSVQGYSGPDTQGHAISGTCKDLAGNTSNASAYTVKYDTTAPQVTGVTPAPDPSGWYTQPVVFGFQGIDGVSGLDSCPTVTYDGPDGADAFVTGVCLDKAGNVGTKPFPLKYDDTGPQVTPSASRGPDLNGWYNGPLSVSFAGSDGASGLASCAPPQGYDGPDSVFAVVTGTCTDNAGNVGLGSLALKYDSTAPQVVGASPDRAPDGNGWYNHALTVSFLGSDATSQIETCTAAGYAGPDNPSAFVSGSCRDRAGNPSGASPFAFKYDASAPSLVSLRVKAGNRSAVLTWVASPDASLVEIVRTAGARGLGVTVYRGTGRSFTDTRLQNGIRYRYTLKGFDEARNVATREAVATPTAPLISPRAGATISAPPRLVWKAVEKATYYNVQVWRRGKIFSAWPTGTSLQLKRAWKYAGRSYRLSPGRYNWYVWPGYRSRARKDFGPLLGSSSFVVKAPRR
jgi:large repetitive protein